MNTIFPELNIEFLTLIANRWLIKYHKREVYFDRILLYHNASDNVGGRNPVKYAVVFEIFNYDGKYEFLDLNDTYDVLEQKWIEGANDPYSNFIGDTGYVYSEGADELLYSDFSGVYANTATDDFVKEWEFIPLYKGLSLTEQVRVNEGSVVLYDATDQFKRLSQNEERAIFNQFLKPVLEAYNIQIQYEYKDNPKTLVPDFVGKVRCLLIGFSVFLDPQPGEANRPDDHPYSFIQDVIDVLMENKELYPDKGPKNFNPYLVKLKQKFQKEIKSIVTDCGLPYLLKELSLDAEEVGIEIRDLKQSKELGSVLTNTENGKKEDVLKKNKEDIKLVPYIKYIEKIKKFCRETKGQSPTRPEVENFLTQELTKNKEKLGKRSQLPESIIRKILKELPLDCKRPIGEKTKKNSI